MAHREFLSQGLAEMATQIQELQKQMEQLRIEHAKKIANQHHDDRGRQRGGGHKERRRDDKLEGVKIKIPSFFGRNDPEAYLKWEFIIEQFFDCNTYDERKKLKVAVQELKEYALVWWVQFQEQRRKMGKKPIDTWEDMKVVMRRRYAPRDIINSFPSLSKKAVSKKEGDLSSNKHKTIQRKVEPTNFSKELKRVLSLKDNIIKRERKHERRETKENMSETLERGILESETLVKKKELSKEQRKCETNTLSENTISVDTLSKNQSEELCLNSNFLNESLVHSGVCLNVQEIFEDASQFVQPMEDETMKPSHDVPWHSQLSLESTIQENNNMELVTHVDCENVKNGCLKDRLGIVLPLHDSVKQINHWHHPKVKKIECLKWNEPVEDKKHSSPLFMQPRVNCLDRNFHYFVVSVTAF